MYLRATRIMSWVVLWLTLGLLSTIVVAIDPNSLNQLGTVAVFGLCFLLITSVLFLGLLRVSEHFLGRDRTLVYRWTALRQSVLLSLFCTTLLVAQYTRVLTWWGMLLGLALILLIELTVRRFSTSQR